MRVEKLDVERAAKSAAWRGLESRAQELQRDRPANGLRDCTATTTLTNVADASNKYANIKRTGRDGMYELMFALAILTATVAVAEGADKYNCGASTCICTGSIECHDMRNSVKCGGKVACHTSSKNQLICTCRRQDLKK